MSDPVPDILAEQQRYYRARAPEYDDWWERRGRYDRGPAANARWFAEVAELGEALGRFEVRGDVLEIACGTGRWTGRLAERAASVTALDASPEVIELARRRVGEEGHDRVDFLVADIFSWQPERRYDVCFFAFWLSHVPDARFEDFWGRVAASLRPGGRVFLLDSISSPYASAADHADPPPDQETMTRRLADGREFRIVKRFYDPGALAARLRPLGFAIDAGRTHEFFLHAHGHLLD